MNSRLIPKLTVTTRAGSDPDVIESIDDYEEVYAEWPLIVCTCPSPNAPAGHCEYIAEDDFEACIYCGMPDR